MIQGQTLTGIADAIRAQLGTETQYTPEEMPGAIQSISGGESEDALLSGVGLTNYKNNSVAIIRSYVFAFSPVVTAYFGDCSEINNSAFQSAGKMTYIYIGGQSPTIKSNVFAGSTSLTAVILSSDVVGSLSSTNAFTLTPIYSGTGYIYVPDDLVDQYKVATNWATYAAQIKGLSEIPADVQEWLDQMEAAA